MKKLIVLVMAASLACLAFVSCRGKVQEVPPPPQAQEQPKVEKVVEAPVVKPQLSEEEIFMSKSLEQINKEAPLAMIHFDYDRYFIREDAKPVLEKNAAWMNKFKTAKILIEGHCDERGTEEYNLALGEKRAQSTYNYLLNLGLSMDRMKIISYGKSQPLDPASNEAAWAKNRRAQFIVIEK